MPIRIHNELRQPQVTYTKLADLNEMRLNVVQFAGIYTNRKLIKAEIFKYFERKLESCDWPYDRVQNWRSSHKTSVVYLAPEHKPIITQLTSFHYIKPSQTYKR